jgi:exopolyphosphatase / guanosine-5'-triphosphate,3'-diphosphate pyrophosphatase
VTRVAAFDCGTNSLRVLVADLDPVTGGAKSVIRRTTIVRLGQGVDRTGAFADTALKRTFAAIETFAAEVEALGAERIRFVATSAARDVANREEFVAGVRARVGVEPEVISGDEEALLSYTGATRELVRDMNADEPVVVVDVGGGSTEFVVRDGDSGRVAGRSLDIGSVRMTERHLHDDPPTRGQVAAAQSDIDAVLETLELPLTAVGTLVGVAGTVTTMAAMVLDLPRYDPDRVDLARLPAPRLFAAVDRIVAMSVEQRRALPFMHPDRADVIGGGALVIAGALRHLDVSELVASEHDILDGIAWSLA